MHLLSRIIGVSKIFDLAEAVIGLLLAELHSELQIVNEKLAEHDSEL